MAERLAVAPQSLPISGDTVRFPLLLQSFAQASGLARRAAQPGGPGGLAHLMRNRLRKRSDFTQQTWFVNGIDCSDSARSRRAFACAVFHPDAGTEDEACASPKRAPKSGGAAAGLRRRKSERGLVGMKCQYSRKLCIDVRDAHDTFRQLEISPAVNRLGIHIKMIMSRLRAASRVEEVRVLSRRTQV